MASRCDPPMRDAPIILTFFYENLRLGRGQYNKAFYSCIYSCCYCTFALVSYLRARQEPIKLKSIKSRLSALPVNIRLCCWLHFCTKSYECNEILKYRPMVSNIFQSKFCHNSRKKRGITSHEHPPPHFFLDKLKP
jgi:hypothetical protein